VTRRAVVLSGSLGAGHVAMAEAVAEALPTPAWSVRTVDAMALLGSWSGRWGEAVFRRLLSVPPLYDVLHFGHLRPGSRLAVRLDQAAARRLLPAVQRDLQARPADLLVSVFPTGASVAAAVRRAGLPVRTVVVCPDAVVHRLWAWPGTDLFVVSSGSAAASVRRYLPRAQVVVAVPPVRAAFFQAPPRGPARAALGLTAESSCVLLLGGGWGLGPLVQAAEQLAGAGVEVLAVAGRNRGLERRLRALPATDGRVHVFGFTDQMPQLMAAADVVVTTAGALTCHEARVVGRPLVLIDALPGHGRDNLQRELELGGAAVAGIRPEEIRAAVQMVLAGDGPAAPAPPTGRWAEEFRAALGRVDLTGESV
jgi:processive 1,2-diacylglycerol beta-glucosyltransferase